MGVLNEILRQSVLMFLWSGSIVGFLVGAGILFKPDQIVLLNQYFSRWVGSGKLGRLLDSQRMTERFFYRHNRLVGSGLLIGALVVLYTFLFRYNLRTISAFIPRNYWWLSDALMGMLLIATVVAALIGIIVLTKPSLLRDVEKSANHWISTEHLLTLFNGMHYSAEQTLIRHNRITGLSIMLGSLYILVVLGYFLFGGIGKP